MLASTPHGEGNLFHRIVTEAEAGLLPSARAVRRTIKEMNPDVTDSWLEARRAELGEPMYRQEYEASFEAGTSNFYDLSKIVFDDRPATPHEGRNWLCGLDVAFHADMTGVCVIGESVDRRGELVVGAVAGLAPKGFGGAAVSFERRRAREDQMLDEVWRLIAPYAPGRLLTDVHQAPAVSNYFGRRGLSVQVVNVTGPMRTSMFVAARARLEDGSLRAWSHPQLLADLRRVRGTGADGIELPRAGGSHQDVAVAFCLAAWQFRGVSDAPPGRVSAGPNRIDEPFAAELGPVAGGAVPGRPDVDRKQFATPPPGWSGRQSIRDMQW